MDVLEIMLNLFEHSGRKILLAAKVTADAGDIVDKQVLAVMPIDVLHVLETQVFVAAEMVVVRHGFTLQILMTLLQSGSSDR